MAQLGTKLVNSDSPFKFSNTRDTGNCQLSLRPESGCSLLLGQKSSIRRPKELGYSSNYIPTGMGESDI